MKDSRNNNSVLKIIITVLCILILNSIVLVGCNRSSPSDGAIKKDLINYEGQNFYNIKKVTVDRELIENKKDIVDCVVKTENEYADMTFYLTLSYTKYDRGGWQIDSLVERKKTEFEIKNVPQNEFFIEKVQAYIDDNDEIIDTIIEDPIVSKTNGTGTINARLFTRHTEYCDCYRTCECSIYFLDGEWYVNEPDSISEVFYEIKKVPPNEYFIEKTQKCIEELENNEIIDYSIENPIINNDKVTGSISAKLFTEHATYTDYYRTYECGIDFRTDDGEWHIIEPISPSEELYVTLNNNMVGKTYYSEELGDYEVVVTFNSLQENNSGYKLDYSYSYWTTYLNDDLHLEKSSVIHGNNSIMIRFDKDYYTECFSGEKEVESNFKKILQGQHEDETEYIKLSILKNRIFIYFNDFNCGFLETVNKKDYEKELNENTNEYTDRGVNTIPSNDTSKYAAGMYGTYRRDLENGYGGWSLLTLEEIDSKSFLTICLDEYNNGSNKVFSGYVTMRDYHYVCECAGTELELIFTESDDYVGVEDTSDKKSIFSGSYYSTEGYYLPDRVYVNAPDGYVNLRSGPGTEYEIICPVNNGEKLEVWSKSFTSKNGKEWKQVLYTKDSDDGLDEYVGYVIASQIN
ncbi:SH3 domain-containing protein [Lachnospiraceae bacterium KH1T2]|nr:SH3 domain-containing protein [Lachnospiraceae bacterium KH1T2]